MSDNFDENEFLDGDGNGGGQNQQNANQRAAADSDYVHLQIGQRSSGRNNYEHMQNLNAYGDGGTAGGNGGQANGSGGNRGGDAGNDQQDAMGKAVLSLAEQISELHRSTRYATGLSNLKILRGTEGSEGIRKYFREFELMTSGWSEHERVEALNVKLEHRARLTMSSMPSHLQHVYSAVKAEILERLANDESKRVTKLSELMTGKPRKPSEPILDFGERVLKLVCEACDPSVPSKQVDEMAKAYFLTYVNDRELIASLTEKQDALEFRYLVDHAAALRANIDRSRRIATETSNNQQAQTSPQGPPASPQQQNRPTRAGRGQGNAQQQPRLNPYRTDLRYQGFPPAKGNFQTQVSPGQRPSNAATDIVQSQDTDAGDDSVAAQGTVATPPNSDRMGSHEQALNSDWWSGESSYTEPRPRVRRRRSKARVHFQDDTTNMTLTVADASPGEKHCVVPSQVSSSGFKKRIAYEPPCLLDIWQCLPFSQIQKFRPLSRHTSNLYAKNKAFLPCRYTPEHGRTCDAWFTEDEEEVQEEKDSRHNYAPTPASSDSVAECRWHDHAPTLTSLDSVVSSLAVGPNCTAIVRIRGVPCEALLDSGSRVSILEGSYLKGILQKSGGNPETLPVHASAVASVVCGNRSTFDPAAATSLSVTYGSCSSPVEFLIAKAPMAFPLILGTNCLSDLGFELINKHTGEELLSTGVEVEDDENEEAACPAFTVCAATSAFIAPYQTARLQVRAPETDGAYMFTSSQGSGTGIQCCLVDATDSQADIWLTNDASSPLILDPGQKLGVFEAVAETYSSSDFLSTGLLEELMAQCHTGTSASMSTPHSLQDTALPHAALTPEERLAELLRLLEPAEIPLTEQQRQELEAELLEFNDVFALSDKELGRTSLVQHKIELLDHTPVRVPPRPVPYALRGPVADMVQDYFERKIISPSTSSYSSPITLARKKDGSLRFCTDFRVLNSRTKKFAMPLPNIDFLLLTMGPKQYFSSLDLLGAYWQMELEEESKQYTAFPALNQLWEFNVLCFGLTNAPGSFQQFMQRLFDGILNDYVYVFLDDILIVSSTWEEHLAHIREVFKRLRTAGLRLKPRKCRLVAREVQYLGHILSSDGLRMDPEKVSAVKNFPRPTCVRDVQSFHGLANHYRKFIQGFALIAHPLYRLIKKGCEFAWSNTEENAFNELKRVLCEEVTLRFPDFEAAKDDPERPLTLQTDACREGIAGILCQKDGRGALRPIHFVSRSTKGAELNYGISELEALSVKYCFNKLAAYLIGLKVRVETDHPALVQMFTKPRECGNARIDKWAMQLGSRFDFYVVYRPGKTNTAADALSRSVKVEGEVTVMVFTRRMAREAREAEVKHNKPLSAREIPAAEPVTEACSETEPRPVDEPFVTGEEKMSWDDSTKSSEFRDVFEYLLSRKLPRDPEACRELLVQAKTFALADGKLHYVDPESGELRLFVPSAFRQKLFSEHHSGIFGTHACGSKIYRMLKKRFWWSAMRGDCEKWARACEVCLHTRRPRRNVPPLQPIVSDCPWDLLCLDLLQLPLSYDGSKYALICIDHFTKYAVVCPLPDKTAESVSDALLREVLLVYGPCRRLHSALGKEFVNKIVIRLRETFSMGQTTTAGYNPRCNGEAERFGRQLIKMLSQTAPIPQDWVQRLKFCLFSYNISPHASTGESPFFLLFCRDPRLPSEVDEDYSVDIDDFRSIMMQNLGQAVKSVQEALEKERERAKKHYDQRNKVNMGKYKTGQRVMVLDPGIGSGVAQKLTWRFFGPFRISEIENNNAKVYPIDKPHADPHLVPLDRLCPIPAEVPNISYARRPDRARIINACTLTVNYLPQVISEIDVGLELSLQPIEITDRIVIREAKAGREASIYESDEKKVVLVALLDDSGLGPYSVCSGSCTSRCKAIHVSNVLPAYSGPEAKQVVQTLAHQVLLVELSKYFDEAELPAKIAVLLGKSADLLNREFADLVGGRPISAPSKELLQAQAYLRRSRCHRVQVSLQHNMTTPIRVFADNADDHRYFTSAVYSSGTVSQPHIGADVLGPIWERVRNGSGRNVVPGPFLAICPPGNEPMFRSDIVRTRTVADLREAIFFLQNNVLDGTVQAVAVSLPPPSKECPRRLDELLNLLGEAAFKHIEIHIIPPPASVFTSYKDILDRLLEEPRPQIAHGGPYGRSFLEIGRLGSGLDKRLVRDGYWTACGMDAARSYLVDVSGIEWLRRPPQPPTPQQNRLRSVVHVPTPVFANNITLTGRQSFQNRQPPAVNRPAPAVPGPSGQRFRPYDRDQGAGYSGHRHRGGQRGYGRRGPGEGR